MESGIYKTKNKGGGGCSGFIFVIGGRGQVGGGLHFNYIFTTTKTMTIAY